MMYCLYSYYVLCGDDCAPCSSSNKLWILLKYFQGNSGWNEGTVCMKINGVRYS